MHRAFSIGLIVVALGLSAQAASASTAEFQGFCTNSIDGSGNLQTACTLTVLRHPSGAPATNCGALGISSTSWTFGDGGSGSSPGTINHTYHGVIGTTINVTVYCADGTQASASHCIYNNIGVGGCVQPGAGWTPP